MPLSIDLASPRPPVRVRAPSACAGRTSATEVPPDGAWVRSSRSNLDLPFASNGIRARSRLALSPRDATDVCTYVAKYVPTSSTINSLPLHGRVWREERRKKVLGEFVRENGTVEMHAGRPGVLESLARRRGRGRGELYCPTPLNPGNLETGD